LSAYQSDLNRPLLLAFYCASATDVRALRVCWPLMVHYHQLTSNANGIGAVFSWKCYPKWSVWS